MAIRSVAAEFVGTALILMTVVGSGVMATTLTSDIGLQLLINSISTVFILYIAITVMAPISGAHFNPVVTLIELIKKKLSVKLFILYISAQLSGASFGAILANAMFELPLINISEKVRSGGHLFLAEIIATAGLVFIINLAVSQKQEGKVPLLVAFWIGAAYFFTSSTSFANPAAVVGRMLSDSFSGIAPESAPLFILAQIFGAFLGYFIFTFLTKNQLEKKEV